MSNLLLALILIASSVAAVPMNEKIKQIIFVALTIIGAFIALTYVGSALV